MGTGKRILDERKRLELTQAQLAKEVGVTDTTIKNYEKGIHAPKPAVLAALARALNVSEDWLRTGEGPRTRLGLFGFSLTHEEHAILANLRGMKPEQRRAFAVLADGLGGVGETLQEMAQARERQEQGKVIQLQQPEREMTTIRLVGRIAAGSGWVNFGEREPEEIDVPAELVAGKEHVALEVRGDSMEPEAPDRSVVIFRRRRPRGRDVAVIETSEACWVKRIDWRASDDETLVLVSDNPAWKPRRLERAKVRRLAKVEHIWSRAQSDGQD